MLENELPSYDDLVRKYGLFKGSSGECGPRIDDQGVVRCGCTGCQRWDAFVKGVPGGRPQYEIFNENHVRALAAYIRHRCATVYATQGDPITVLEVNMP